MENEVFPSRSIHQQQQQRFYLSSLYLTGNYCDSVQLLGLLIAFGSHLRKLNINFDCLLNLINDVNNSTRLKSVMLHSYLIFLELNNMDESQVDSGDFCRVIAFLFDNRNSLRHVTLFPAWYLQIFESIDDMKLLKKILEIKKM